MQKYLHIIESFACIQEIFVLIFLFNINFSVSIQSKYVAYYSHINLSHQFQLISTHQDLLQIPHTLSQINCFFTRHRYIYVHFDHIFVFQNCSIDEVTLKTLSYANHCFNSSYYLQSPGMLFLRSRLVTFTPFLVNRFPNTFALMYLIAS